jgi:pyruvate decarboxylase
MLLPNCLVFCAVVITSAADGPHQIAIRSALRGKKPAYIEIACNIAAAPCAAPGPVSAVVAEELSDGKTRNRPGCHASWPQDL